MDTTGVSPSAQALAIGAAWRDDTPVASLDRVETLAGAPDADREGGLFKVPKVL